MLSSYFYENKFEGALGSHDNEQFPRYSQFESIPTNQIDKHFQTTAFRTSDILFFIYTIIYIMKAQLALLRRKFSFSTCSFACKNVSKSKVIRGRKVRQNRCFHI